VFDLFGDRRDPRNNRERDLYLAVPIGRPVNKAFRQRVTDLLRRGKTQAEICKILKKAPGTIAHHVRELGFPAKKYQTPNPLVRGKRRCTSCGEAKTIGAFPNTRGAECRMCLRAKKES
jgi:hypothetical protein